MIDALTHKGIPAVLHRYTHLQDGPPIFNNVKKVSMGFKNF